ncbi:MAG: amidohydrolase family protein, partial [Deltaproteobacteria bacterium]|nr:amidohydrolase family protein [Deltaproteobacteria bacterium]
MQPEQSGQEITALMGGTLIDGTGAAPAPGSVVLIKGGVIDAVGPRKLTDLPPGCQVIDVSHKTVMPGMMDLHVHLCMGEEDLVVPRGGLLPGLDQPLAMHGLKAFARARRSLEMGFTTLRDVGDFGYMSVALRDAIKAGLVEGPRILSSGQLLTTTGGHADFMPLWLNRSDDVVNVADGVDGVLKAVRRQVKMRTDWVKFFATGGI